MHSTSDRWGDLVGSFLHLLFGWHSADLRVSNLIPAVRKDNRRGGIGSEVTQVHGLDTRPNPRFPTIGLAGGTGTIAGARKAAAEWAS
jgi:hypothetical protein